MLELKSDFTYEETARFIDVIKSYDYLENITFISFIYENLERVRSILPQQSVQFLCDKFNDELIEKLIADKFDVDAHYKSLNKDIIDVLHNAGIKVNCWTVDNKEEAEQLAEWGVDYITSNILE